MWYLLIALLIGVAYGYAATGKQDKSRLFMKGLLYGVILAVIVGLLAFFFDISMFGLAEMGVLGIIIAAALTALAFIVGVWIGDMLERRKHTSGGPRRV